MKKNTAMIAAAMFAALVITATDLPSLHQSASLSANAADRDIPMCDELSDADSFAPNAAVQNDCTELKACEQFALCSRKGFRVLGAAKDPAGEGWVFLIQNDTREWHELAQTDGKACSGIELEYYREFCPSELSSYPAVLLDVNASADTEMPLSLDEALDIVAADSRWLVGGFTLDYAVFDAQTNGWKVVLQSTNSSVRVEYVFAANEPLSVHIIQ